jgi:hypothetical protein
LFAVATSAGERLRLVVAERLNNSSARCADCDTSDATVLATAAPMAAPIRVPLTPKTEAAAAAARAARAEAMTS